MWQSSGRKNVHRNIYTTPFRWTKNVSSAFHEKWKYICNVFSWKKTHNFCFYIAPIFFKLHISKCLVPDVYQILWMRHYVFVVSCTWHVRLFKKNWNSFWLCLIWSIVVFCMNFSWNWDFFSIYTQQFLFTTWWIRSLSIPAIEYTAKWVQTHIKTKFNEHVYCVEMRILSFLFFLSLKVSLFLKINIISKAANETTNFAYYS